MFCLKNDLFCSLLLDSVPILSHFSKELRWGGGRSTIGSLWTGVSKYLIGEGGLNMGDGARLGLRFWIPYFCFRRLCTIWAGVNLGDGDLSAISVVYILLKGLKLWLLSFVSSNLDAVRLWARLIGFFSTFVKTLLFWLPYLFLISDLKTASCCCFFCST